MFETRLKVILILLVLATLVVAGRLSQLQIAQAEHYQERAAQAPLRPASLIPAVRGRIVDRTGRLVASDEPSWDLCMYYPAMCRDETYIKIIARRWRRRGQLPTYTGLSKAEQHNRDVDAITRRIDDSYALLAELSGHPLDQILERRDYILKRVAAIQRILLRRRGYFVPPGETLMYHPLAPSVDDQTAVEARLALSKYDWLTVRASTRRAYHDAESMGHLVGRLGRVTKEIMESDPFKEQDERRRYLPWETYGVAGIEHLCEDILRGRRGRERKDRDGNILEYVQPMDGADAAMTIDAALQERIYEALGKAVQAWPLATGGAAVVIHIPSREVLALVSYPSFDPATYSEDFPDLIADTKYRPTLFRAVAGVYPPGSVAKPAALATGLALNLITPETRLDCHGYLHNPQGRFKCWIYKMFNVSHNSRGFPNGLNAEEALQVSCNCYFYQLGEKIGGDRLCQWLRRFWIGPPPAKGQYAGTGLIEEREGILPTAAWLWEHQRRPMRVGDSRNFAVGQGELGLTPIQVANLMATLATGEFRWPTLILGDGRERPTWELGLKPEHLRTIRRGLYRVVNNDQGTAYRYARMKEIVVAGKTGSAQCSRIVLDKRYVVEYPDGRREKIVAKSRREAEKEIADTPGARIVGSRMNRLWPPKDKACAHAWFAGFVPGEPEAEPVFAIAALVEFGESGGKRAAPVANEMIKALLESPRGYLRPAPPTVAAR